MNHRPQTYSSNDSYRNPESKPQPKGALMSGLAYGVGTQLANTSIQGIQNSALHPHIENPPMREPLKESSSVNTPVFSANYMKKGQDPCRKQMDKLNQCMQQNDQDMDKCKSQIGLFQACRQDHNY